MLVGTVGAVQLTFNCVAVFATGDTVRAVGAAGGSLASVTVMVSVLLTDNARAPVPLVAVMVAIYSLLLAAFAGVVLCTSVGFSKSGAVLKVNSPDVVERLNAALSAPLSA